MNEEKISGNILIVDDTPDNLHLLTEMLVRQDYHVRAVKSGREALSSIRAALPDLILLDVMMPGLDGIETLHEIRKFVSHVTTPVIALTGFTQLGDRDRLAEGFNQYISKPFNKSTLNGCIRSVMK